MPLLDIRVIPLGTQTPGVSEFITEAVRVAEDSGLSYQLTPMSTCIEGSLDELLDVARRMHEASFGSGVQRVVTILTIDDRRDERETLDDKVSRVTDDLQQ
ncbi:MAG: MTH1187 family thiamine-binding protein [Armatimonadota bacterium]